MATCVSKVTRAGRRGCHGQRQEGIVRRFVRGNAVVSHGLRPRRLRCHGVKVSGSQGINNSHGVTPVCCRAGSHSALVNRHAVLICAPRSEFRHDVSWGISSGTASSCPNPKTLSVRPAGMGKHWVSRETWLKSHFGTFPSVARTTCTWPPLIGGRRPTQHRASRWAHVNQHLHSAPSRHTADGAKSAVRHSPGGIAVA